METQRANKKDSRVKLPIYTKYFESIIMGFIFFVLFLFPVLFTRIGGQISWHHVTKIWIDQLLLIPLFALNHWLFVPKLLLKKRYYSYLLSALGLIAIFTLAYYYYDIILNVHPISNQAIDLKRPSPIPPYARLLIYSVLIVGVDTGLLFSKKWHEIETERYLLEKKNAEMELDILRNQLSPHFFMNTLNNIYALIDFDSAKAKQAVMKLSKLMRYMLYENENGKVRLSKEFEFINSYIDLMKLRYADEMTIDFKIPEKYDDIFIPPLLFISFIENAFKHGASYENESYIRINFNVLDTILLFSCENSKQLPSDSLEKGGLGVPNSLNRIKLLYGDQYLLAINSNDKSYTVELKIPLL